MGWEPESVRGVKNEDGEWRLKIRWANYPPEDDTWELLEEVCHLEIVREYIDGKLESARRKCLQDHVHHFQQIKRDLEDHCLKAHQFIDNENTEGVGGTSPAAIAMEASTNSSSSSHAPLTSNATLPKSNHTASAKSITGTRRPVPAAAASLVLTLSGADWLCSTEPSKPIHAKCPTEKVPLEIATPATVKAPTPLVVPPARKSSLSFSSSSSSISESSPPVEPAASPSTAPSIAELLVPPEAVSSRDSSPEIPRTQSATELPNDPSPSSSRDSSPEIPARKITSAFPVSQPREESPEIAEDPRLSSSAPFYPSTADTDSDDECQAAANSYSSSDSGSDTEYVVRKVVGVVGLAPTRRFQVLWEDFGSDEDSWEPEANVLHLDLVKEFLARKIQGAVVHSRPFLSASVPASVSIPVSTIRRVEPSKRRQQASAYGGMPPEAWQRSFSRKSHRNKITQPVAVLPEFFEAQPMHDAGSRIQLDGFRIPRRVFSTKKSTDDNKPENEDDGQQDDLLKAVLPREDTRLYRLIMRSSAVHPPNKGKSRREPTSFGAMLPTVNFELPPLVAGRFDGTCRRLAYLKASVTGKQLKPGYEPPPLVTPVDHVLETAGTSKFLLDAPVRKPRVIHDLCAYFNSALYFPYQQYMETVQPGDALDPEKASKAMSNFVRFQFKQVEVVQHCGHADVQKFLKEKQCCRKEVTRPRRIWPV
ncbi:hypothetical protein BV898_05258 [Hypsibius exemplaris]|uniref:Chromo domain-containing protein n=1 Tax=Hypsibius exemplaris TaxID=2072580 RepID=A0A1W0WZN4_HYPEX|nr:hypothetical protein BV898_05258 [Hypsibius exemplaris]